jgi:2-methylcitrate dehydratase
MDADAAMRDLAADPLLVDIADYAAAPASRPAAAVEAAHLSLMDALAGGFIALGHPGCRRMLGPLVPGATMTHGARVPGTSYELDPAMAAFNIGAMVGWVADTAAAPDPGTPADIVGGILAVGDYLSRKAHNEARKQPLVRDLLAAMITAHEIQSVLALDPGFAGAGLDHTLLVRVACAASVTAMLGGSREQIVNATSHAWIDAGPLRAYRHAPNAGPRRGWAAGDAASRGVRLAFMAMAGDTGCPSALSAPDFGFYDALCDGRPLSPPRRFGSHAMESLTFDRGALLARFDAGVAGHFEAGQAALIQARFADRRALWRTPVNEVTAILVKNG